MLVERVIALLSGLRPEDIDAASPARRQEFIHLARHWADLAERRQAQSRQLPRSGRLFDARRGVRPE